MGGFCRERDVWGLWQLKCDRFFRERMGHGVINEKCLSSYGVCLLEQSPRQTEDLLCSSDPSSTELLTLGSRNDVFVGYITGREAVHKLAVPKPCTLEVAFVSP